MKELQCLAICVSFGIFIALATGLVSNTPMNLVGATWYGYPIAWLIRLVIAPQYNPWRIHPIELVLDIILWSAVVGVISFIAKCWRKPATRRSKASRR